MTVVTGYTQKAVKFGTILKILAILLLIVFVAICFIPQLGVGTWVSTNAIALGGWLLNQTLICVTNGLFWAGVFVIAIPVFVYSTRKYWHKQKVAIIPTAGATNVPLVSNIPNNVFPNQNQPVEVKTE